MKDNFNLRHYFNIILLTFQPGQIIILPCYLANNYKNTIIFNF